MYVGLLMREWLIRLYNFSHSSGLRERNIILFPDVILDLLVGGERTIMSKAVPRRMGTSGVNSSAISGYSEILESGSEESPVDSLVCIPAGLQCMARIPWPSLM